MLVGPVSSLGWAPRVSQLVGQHTMRAGRNAGTVEELGRRLVLQLAVGEKAYAACTMEAPDHDLGVMIATDRRLIGAAGFFDSRWALDADWRQVQGARVTVTRSNVRYDLVIDGVYLKLTGPPQYGAAALVAMASHKLAELHKL